MESQLALEKERLKVTLELIADGVISTDADGLVIFMNQAAEQMTGWSSAEAAGTRTANVFTIIDGATGAQVPDPIAECLSRGALYHADGETVLVQRNRDRHDVSASAAPVRSQQGKVIGTVLVFQDVTDSRARQRELAHTAMHDSLTGLPNRATFERALTEALEQSRREMREHAICFIDIDRFKLVNDQAGHGAGDALLRSISDAIRASCRTADLAGRIGGDEFALLLPDCSKAGAKRVAQEIVGAIAALKLTWGGTTFQVGASIGITAVTAKSRSLEEVMREADAACYVAKANGRNQVAFYDGEKRGLDQLERSADASA